MLQNEIRNRYIYLSLWRLQRTNVYKWNQKQLGKCISYCDDSNTEKTVAATLVTICIIMKTRIPWSPIAACPGEKLDFCCCWQYCPCDTLSSNTYMYSTAIVQWQKHIINIETRKSKQNKPPKETKPTKNVNNSGKEEKTIVQYIIMTRRVFTMTSCRPMQAKELSG